MAYIAIDNINDLDLPHAGFGGERLYNEVRGFLGGANFPTTIVLDAQKARTGIACVPNTDEQLNQYGFGNNVIPGYDIVTAHYEDQELQSQPSFLCYLQLVPSRNPLAEGEYKLLVQLPMPDEYQDAERTIPVTVTTSEIAVRPGQEILTWQQNTTGTAIVHRIGIIQDVVDAMEPNGLPQVIINFYAQESAPEIIPLEAA